jgi:predicted negative regulator of RcsB-dependent stress response
MEIIIIVVLAVLIYFGYRSFAKTTEVTVAESAPYKVDAPAVAEEAPAKPARKPRATAKPAVKKPAAKKTVARKTKSK